MDQEATNKRPWGYYIILDEGNRYKVKLISVHPGKRLSLQMHRHRSEHWVIVQGSAKVTLGQEEHLLHVGDSIFIPVSNVHRVENNGKIPLLIIEVQTGEYLEEDDIIRYEDDFGRLEKK